VIGLLIATAWNLTQTQALAQAERAYIQGDLGVCLQHAMDHLTRRPWSRSAALLAARCLSRLDYADEAEPYFRRAGELSLTDWQLRAYGLVRGPHPERAIPAYHEILDRSPENVAAMRRLAAVLLAQNNTQELLKLADRLSHVPDGAVIGYLLRGVAYHNDKNPQQAVAAFEKVLELDPEFRQMPSARSMFWTHFTEDLASSGRLADAARYLNQALTDAPDVEWITRLGTTYFLQGDLDEAEHWYHQAIRWDPNRYTPYLQLAKIALQRQQRDQALKLLNQARKLAPTQYAVLYNLVSLYHQLGQEAESEQIQKTIQELRAKAASPTRPVNGQWPPYAL
jgi:tetratricopeptide (TPR) repeat protein